MRYFFAVLAFLFFGIGPIYASLNDVDRQIFFARNQLKNGGFESGKGAGVDKWTASAGTFNITITGSNLLDGKVSATWDAAASANTLSYGQITIPNGLLGRNGVLAAKIMVPSGTATHSLQVTDGTNVLGSVTITSSTAPTYSYVNFIYPSSGYVVPRLYANADEPNIVIDSVFLGDAETVNLTNIAQAQFIGAGYFATTANCSGWSRTNTALGAFASDADCPGPTVEINPGPGTIQTTDVDLPKFTVNNLPPGNYEVWVTVPTLKDATGNPCTFTLNDGTTSSGRGNCGSTASAADGVTFAGHFNYTTAGNRTFEVYGASGSGAIAIDNSISNKSLQFWIYRYPIASEQAFKPSQVPFLWQGYHDSDCGFSRTNTALGLPAGDASCTFASYTGTNYGSVTSTLNGAATLTPGIGLVLPKTGMYEVCANVGFTGATTGAAEGMAIVTSGSITLVQQAYQQAASLITVLPICGWHNATSPGLETFTLYISGSSGSTTIGGNASIRAINWYVKYLSQNMPMPLLVNSVNNTSTGVTGVEVAKLNCDAGSAIMSQHGSWVSSIGNVSGGACAVTLAAGAFSATPYCTATSATAGGISTGLELNVDATSATAVSVDCEDDASTACSAFDFILHCVGAK